VLRVVVAHRCWTPKGPQQRSCGLSVAWAHERPLLHTTWFSCRWETVRQRKDFFAQVHRNPRSEITKNQSGPGPGGDQCLSGQSSGRDLRTFFWPVRHALC